MVRDRIYDRSYKIHKIWSRCGWTELRAVNGARRYDRRRIDGEDNRVLLQGSQCLGAGFSEKVYENSMRIALNHERIKVSAKLQSTSKERLSESLFPIYGSKIESL
jgi:hypothetical protein